MYDVSKVREDFPILSREVYGKPLVYLDNAATTQKPLCVLDAMREEYLNVNANVHRGVHWLSQQQRSCMKPPGRPCADLLMPVPLPRWFLLVAQLRVLTWWRLLSVTLSWARETR